MKLDPAASRNCQADFRCGLEADFFAGLATMSRTYRAYHLYYPSRRQAAPVFALLIEALGYRGSSR
jgi:hypothetical protein